MDFDFKKARKIKQKQDKARSTHRHHPDQKPKKSDNELKQKNSSQTSGEKDYTTALKTTEKLLVEDKEDIPETKSFSRRVIVSNWERYELPPDTLEEQTEEALDFETLIKSISDVKGHLKLSHEQSWGNKRSELQEDFFNIDMGKLCASLETVPYHVRQNLPVSLFTPEQLAVFEQDADDARKHCLSKIPSKEDHVLQKESVLPTINPSTTEINSSKPVDDIVCMPVATLETNGGEENRVTEESSTNRTTEVPSCQTSKTTNLSEENEGKSACPLSEELDLDFLLSLDAALPDKPKFPQEGDISGLTVATSSQVSQTGKLDDWLDDLLDD